jgi:hypothetical protein
MPLCLYGPPGRSAERRTRACPPFHDPESGRGRLTNLGRPGSEGVAFRPVVLRLVRQEVLPTDPVGV